MNAAPSSGRVPAASSARASARSSARGSTRGSAVQRDPVEEQPPARSARKTKGGGGKELIICSVIIVGLVIACGILWVHRSNEQQAHDAEKNYLKQAREKNVERAFKAFTLAQSVGHEFVIGKKPDATRESLVSSLQGDPTVYNVIFTWTYKKKQQNFPVQHALHSDPEHMNIKQTGKGTVKEGINMVYGYTSSDQPIYIATKLYPPPQGEKNNLGGEIMVIVNAEREDRRAAGTE
jgi:hypothetical protein